MMVGVLAVGGWREHARTARLCRSIDEWVPTTIRTYLPGAGKAAVVEEDVSLAEHARLPVLLVLLDGVPRLVRRDLELPPRELGAVSRRIG